MDVERCYDLIEGAGAAPLDNITVIDFVLETRSWAAIYMLLAWVALMRNDTERSRRLFAEAEERCRDDHELAYVLHLQALALCRTEKIEESGRRSVMSTRERRNVCGNPQSS